MRYRAVKIIMAFCAYGAAVLAAEATLGNGAFPWHLWVFTRMPAWHWSLPVHACGFTWILYCSVIFVRKPAVVPAAVSGLYFIAMETLNLAYFRCFDYTPIGGSELFSFGAVIVLYLLLCLAMSLIIRKALFTLTAARGKPF
jgi:hypothetical protein